MTDKPEPNLAEYVGRMVHLECDATIKVLRAENERLRVALVKALELIGDLDYDEYSKADEAAEILRAALGSDQRPL